MSKYRCKYNKNVRHKLPLCPLYCKGCHNPCRQERSKVRFDFDLQWNTSKLWFEEPNSTQTKKKSN